MSNEMENNPTAVDDGRSPCVRAFVANFERRDSSAGIGNENRPPVMTKSKVALLRQTLGKPSDSVKSASSDSESSSKTHEAGDSDDNSEHIVSVAKLKENLQKSAKEKPIAPWAFGGAGRPVKEPKKPPPKHRSDAAPEVKTKSSKTDIPPNASERTKRRMNSSFKESQQNLIDSPVMTDSLDENVFFGSSVTVSSVSNHGNSFQGQLGRSTSSDNQIGEKHKLAPKVLPKPVPRKSKPKLVNVSREQSHADDKRDRTAYQNNDVTLDDSSNLTTSKKHGSNEALLGNSTSNSHSDTPEVFHRESGDAVTCSEEIVNHLREMNQTENTSMNVTGEDVHNSTENPHDVDTAHTKTTEDRVIDCTSSSDELHTGVHLETLNEDFVRTTDAGNAVPPVTPRTRCRSSIDDENSDDGDDHDMDDTVTVTRSTSKGSEEEHILPGSSSDHRVSSESTSAEQNDRASSSVSSEHMTDLVITDDESITDNNRCSKTDDESILPSRENRTRSLDEDMMRRTYLITLAQDSTQAHDSLQENGDTIESAASECDKSIENSSFLLCMGPDFISDIKELSAMTAAEEEYEALAVVVCCKMLEEDEESVSWLLCPPETYRSTVDYVGSLFKDDILVGIGERKFGTWDATESSFMSPDLLREALLDKATKKLECLKHRKQKLEAVATKQVELEELVDAVVKEKVDSRQYSKYRSTLEEFDQVTHLLLMLSSRLANTDNSLDQISFSDQEQQKVQLISKRDNLIEKFKEAQSIKESSETRRRQLAECLQQRLKVTEYFDYRQLVKTKCQLKIVRHSLEDRVSLSEEQIKILVAIIEKNTSARYC